MLYRYLNVCIGNKMYIQSTRAFCPEHVQHVKIARIIARNNRGENLSIYPCILFYRIYAIHLPVHLSI